MILPSCWRAAEAARLHHLVDPLQQPAPDAGALSRRIDRDLMHVEVFLLRFPPHGTHNQVHRFHAAGRSRDETS